MLAQAFTLLMGVPCLKMERGGAWSAFLHLFPSTKALKTFLTTYEPREARLNNAQISRLEQIIR